MIFGLGPPHELSSAWQYRRFIKYPLLSVSIRSLGELWSYFWWKVMLIGWKWPVMVSYLRFLFLVNAQTRVDFPREFNLIFPFFFFYSFRTGWSKLPFIRDGHDVYFLHHRPLHAGWCHLFDTWLANARDNYERTFPDLFFLLVVSE